ncbi:MAG: tubulin/FtsZ family protein [Halorientalis sp.]
MKIGLISVGQAGGKIADALLEYEQRSNETFIADVLAVNTAKADLLGLDLVPVENRVLIGQSRVKGHGAGADNELGAKIAQEDTDEVMNAVAQFPTSTIDAFLVVAGLGGGTGSGGAPVFARELARRYDEPTYGLGVLPGREEGGIYQLNAARSFRTFVREVDNLVLFDNESWRRGGGESLQMGYDYINRELATRIGILLTAGEASEATPESVVDASEIINTLSGGGVTSVGYATSELTRARRGLLQQFSSAPKFETTDTVNQITTTVRQAALGRLSLPCELAGVQRALVVVAGPPEALSRRGVERAMTWIEEQTGSMEVRGGDYPIPDEDRLAALVVFSGLSNAPRLDELKQMAVETQQNIEQIRERAPAAFDDLVWSGDDDELEPLF